MKSLSRAVLSLRVQRLQRRKALEVSVRNFSSSQSCFAYFPPPFEPTTSSELDDLLSTIRRKVLLPRHLKGETRKLVSNPVRSEQLKLEDVRVQLGGQEEQLVPHSYAKDGVSFHKTFQRVLDLTADMGQFTIWDSLVRGYDGAYLELDIAKREKLVRKMCTTGKVTALLDLLDSSTSKLDAAPLVMTLIPNSIRSQALTSDYATSARSALSNVDANLRAKFTQAFEEGRPTIDLLSEIPGLARAQARALQRGLKSAVRFNLVLSRKQQHKLLEAFISQVTGEMLHPELKNVTAQLAQRRAAALNDSILVAVPLELQSRLEAALAIDPIALGSMPAEGVKAPAVAQSTTLTAADYASRLLNTLRSQPITSIPSATSPSFDESSTTKSAADLLVAQQTIWLSRALLVGASLRAATQATTVKNDKALLKDVQTRLPQIEGHLAAAVKQLGPASELPLQLRLLAEQYQRYASGKEWALHGEHVYKSAS